MKPVFLLPLTLLALTAPASSAVPLSVPLSVSLGQDEPSAEDLFKARVKAMVTELELAFEEGQTEQRVAALERAVEVPHEAVVAQVVHGLKDDARAVLDATIETLRYMQHPTALDALHKTLTRDKRFKQSLELTPKLLRAIGQHGDPASIGFLTKNLFRGDPKKDREITGARILALANIRSKQSVEALIDLMNRASPLNVQPHMRDVRLALLALTGVDRGKSREAWQSWWNDNKKKLIVTELMPLLPKQDQRDWERFWGKPRSTQRDPKRGERGRD